MESNQTVFGIAWFSRDEWRQLKAVAADRDALDDTYEEWLSTAEKTLKDLEANRIVVEKVNMTVDQLLKWCRRKNRVLDSEARSEYASIKVRELHLD